MIAKPYVVHCTVESCDQPATYKVAAAWSDGTIQELKTYGLSCERHLESLFRQSRKKQIGYPLTDSESLGPPQIFRIASGRRDQQLERIEELERKYS